MKTYKHNKLIKNLSNFLLLNLIFISIIYSLQQNKQNKKSQRTISPSSSLTNSTLFEVPIYRNTDISYYYPYFYKSHFITFTDSSLNGNTTFTNLTNDNYTKSQICPDDKCQICLGSGRCLKCFSGSFLTEEGLCVEACETGFIADILRRKCFNLDSKLPDLVFTKAYSFGSCKGNCLKNSLDCRCAADCARKGDCCTDYLSSDCDEISVLVNNDINNSSNSRNKNETGVDGLCADALSGCEICEERSDIGVDSEIDLIFYPFRKKKNLRNRLRENFGLKRNKTSLVNRDNKNLSYRKKNKLKNKQDVSNNQTNFTENFSIDSSSNITDATEVYNDKTNNNITQNKKQKHYICRQCKQGFLMFNGTCVSNCPKGFVSDLHNIECVSENDNSIKCHKHLSNCSRCYEMMHYLPNSSNITSIFSCSKCKRGLFLYNNTCIEKCPEKYRADKMTWNCIPKPIFAWYWDYPSKSSCRNFCSKKLNDTDFTNKNNSTESLNINNTNINGTNSTDIKENRTIEGKNHSNYFDYTNATEILNKIKEDLNIKEDKSEDKKADCACDLGCQQRGNCCYDFDLYCLN